MAAPLMATVATGILNIVVGWIVQRVGKENLDKVLPASVTGSIAIVIGIALAKEALARKKEHEGLSVQLKDQWQKQKAAVDQLKLALRALSSIMPMNNASNCTATSANVLGRYFRASASIVSQSTRSIAAQ